MSSSIKIILFAPKFLMKIAIDGPSAAGKSITAIRLGSALKIPTLDTGIFYRVITAVLLNRVNSNKENNCDIILTEEDIFKDKEIIENLSVELYKKTVLVCINDSKHAFKLEDLRTS